MQIFKSYLKLFLTFPFFLIKDNIGKTILIIISLITFHYAGTFDDVKCEEDIIKTVKVAETNLYIYMDGDSDSEIFKMAYGDDYKVEDGKIKWVESSPGNIILWVLFVISTLVLVIMFFVGLDDDEVGWDIVESWRKALTSTIYTIHEEDTYYYMSFGRLLGKRDTLIRRNNLRYELNINSLGDIFYCPRFQTKT